MIRYWSILISVFLLAACGGSEDPKEKIAETPKPDTGIIKKADNRVNPYVQVDASPMDMAYYPADYPKLKMAGQITGAPLARVIYSRPHLQGRHIFREVLKYGEPWRLGANESTELELYSDAIIQEKKRKAGRYILYCIPQETKWTIVLNSNIETWGLKQDETKDIARFEVPVTKTNNSLEFYTMVFEKTADGANLLMAWDDAEIRLSIKF